MMENVPVKIAERYKPPPQIRQHSVQLNLNKYKPNYYNESPEYQYDFQLERKVLATIPEWRRMRQSTIEARQLRQEKRKQQRLRDFEEKQKQLLGAVSYPSAEDLSSSSLDSGDEENNSKKTEENATTTITTANVAPIAESRPTQNINSFYNILQPTILKLTHLQPTKNDNVISAINSQMHAGNAPCTAVNTTFNYKDFEEDTSSPFDNIELKTINDLDILAQVLHNTQLKENEVTEKILNNEIESTREILTRQVENKEEENSNEILNKAINISLENVNFNHLDKLLENENIPTVQEPQETQQIIKQSLQTKNYADALVNQGVTNLPYSGNLAYTRQNVGTDENYVITPNCNGYNMGDVTNSPHYNSISSTEQYICNHTATYYNTTHFNYSSLQRLEIENNTKSKSVPDIIRELSQEVHNSERRRTRNYSQNMDNEVNSLKATIKQQSESSELSPAINKIIKNICSMGFPLERVTNLVKVIGADDKKIIEHLIPLTELLDLGFDETKISEALIKFDNNKDKALEYLIS